MRLAESVFCLTAPRTTSLGGVPPTGIWPFYINHQSRQCPIDLPTGQFGGPFVSTEVLSDDSSLGQVDIKLASTFISFLTHFFSFSSELFHVCKFVNFLRFLLVVISHFKSTVVR